jgi:acyl-CoA synthetase (AMP-forming)/AMP-acid ligase II
VAAGPDRDQLASDLVAWARERMANYKVPRRISIVDTLPTNASGKVLKYELRSKVAADEDLPAAERRT